MEMLPNKATSNRRYAGLHISGPNTPRSAIVLLEGELLAKPLRISGLYEKIGSQGKLFSDDRFVDILRLSGPFTEVFVDCPLSVPPCVSCQLPVCPGVIKCEDIGVAYMHSLGAKMGEQGKKKKRPINPQSQRVWDVLFQQENPAASLAHPFTYSSNLAPLVVRAQTLQRRLNGVAQPIRLKETSVPYALDRLAPFLRLAKDLSQKYRNFELGKQTRQDVLDSLLQSGWLQNSTDEETIETIAASVELFHAIITALVAALFHAGICTKGPLESLENVGWVYLPELGCDRILGLS